MASLGTSKVLLKIQKTLQEKNFYEAHQMLSTVSQRFIKQQKFSEALDLIQQGIMQMIQVKEFTSALDLTIKWISVFEMEKNEITDDYRDRILCVFIEWPLDVASSDDFCRLIIQWTIKVSPSDSHGDPTLQHLFEGYLYEAEEHLMYGTMESAKALGFLAFHWSQLHEQVDAGYFMTRHVLGLLVLGKLDHAQLALQECIHHFKAKGIESQDKSNGNVNYIEFNSSSLLNFCQLLMACILYGDAYQFEKLIGLYRTNLKFDDYLHNLLEKFIGPQYFGTGPKKAKNPFEEVIKSLLGPTSQQQVKTIANNQLEMDMD